MTKVNSEEGVEQGIKPALVNIPEEVIRDMHERLTRTRWFEAIDGSGWEYGTDINYLRELCDYWVSEFDWYAVQDRFNIFHQVVTRVNGQRLHAFHQRSPRSDATPLLLVHGWPGSAVEFIDVIGPLSDPDAYGAPGAPAFHVVCPSIPGYGFSGPTHERGWDIRRISDAMDTLMQRLGYAQFAGAGGDWGSNILTDLARSDRASSLTALHLTMPTGLPPGPGVEEDLDDFERGSLAHWDHALATGRVNHVNTNTFRPNTMAVGVSDSPAGLLSWIVDMCRSFTVYEGDVETVLTRDQLLANATIYWATGTISSAMRLYYEWAKQKASQPNPPFVTVPVSVSIFPNDIRRWPRSWAERSLHIVDWEVLEAGGHFGSWEQPKLFIDSVRRSLG